MSNSNRTDSIYVAPAPGLDVQDPVSLRKMPPQGAWVPRSVYWLRRLADRDVMEVKPPAPKSTAKPADSKRS